MLTKIKILKDRIRQLKEILEHFEDKPYISHLALDSRNSVTKTLILNETILARLEAGVGVHFVKVYEVEKEYQRTRPTWLPMANA